MKENSKVENIVTAINILKKGKLTYEQIQEICKKTKLSKRERMFIFFELSFEK